MKLKLIGKLYGYFARVTAREEKHAELRNMTEEEFTNSLLQFGYHFESYEPDQHVDMKPERKK